MEETSARPDSPSSPSPKQKLRFKYTACFPSPFRRNNTNNSTHSTGFLPSSPVNSDDNNDNNFHSKQPTLTRISCTSIDKCKNFITRMGRNAQGLAHGHVHGHAQSNGHGHGRGHRRRHSLAANFKYDATSYALNFDEGTYDSSESEHRLRSFSSSLARSPKEEIECN